MTIFLIGDTLTILEAGRMHCHNIAEYQCSTTKNHHPDNTNQQKMLYVTKISQIQRTCCQLA